MRNRAVRWIAAASVAVGVLTYSLAAGSSSNLAGGAPNPPLGGRHFCFHPTLNGVVQPGEPGCVEPGPTPIWTPPVGAVDVRTGHVVHKGDQINGPATSCCGWTADYTFQGKPLTGSEIDYLRLPDGRVRLFVDTPDQIQFGHLTRLAMTLAMKASGLVSVPGMIEVQPAALSVYPIKSGDNSLGWATAAG